jgi:hypothetical protein
MVDQNPDLRRRPVTRYAPTGRVLDVPADALAATLHLLSRAGAHESCVFWYGAREGLAGVVRAVRAPRQATTRFNFHVDEAAMSAMAATLDDAWRPVAQVHSHPGDGVEHSGYDDRMVASRRALSLVFPRYGRWDGIFPDRIGVHEWQDGFWHLLSTADARLRVRPVHATGVDVRDLR